MHTLCLGVVVMYSFLHRVGMLKNAWSVRICGLSKHAVYGFDTIPPSKGFEVSILLAYLNARILRVSVMVLARNIGRHREVGRKTYVINVQYHRAHSPCCVRRMQTGSTLMLQIKMLVKERYVDDNIIKKVGSLGRDPHPRFDEDPETKVNPPPAGHTRIGALWLPLSLWLCCSVLQGQSKQDR